MDIRKIRSYERGDVYYIERGGDAVGSEQYSGRPGIIVSNSQNNRNSTTVEVVYTTTSTNKADLPTHVDITTTPRKSIALCEQIVTVSTERIGNYIGHCTKDEMLAIDVALLKSLGIKVPDLKSDASAALAKVEEYEKKIRQHEADAKAKSEKIESLEHEVAEAKEAVEKMAAAASEGSDGKVAAAEKERDLYKGLYESLLDRMIGVVSSR